MVNWVHNLSVPWLSVVVFAAMLLVAAVIFVVVRWLAVGSREEAFAAVSPGMLPPLGLVFGLMVGFLAAQLWSDSSSAQQAVDREAGSLRSAVVLSSEFPGAPQARIKSLVRRQIQNAVTDEWPAMGRQQQDLSVVPVPLVELLRVSLELPTRSPGQVVAQRELVSAVEDALDARRQRIIISESSLNWAKWAAVDALAVITLVAVAFVHCRNRRTSAIALGLFALAAAVCIVVLAVQDRPFAGPFRVRPTPLVQVEPRITPVVQP
jgi:hypothetical protein